MVTSPRPAPPLRPRSLIQPINRLIWKRLNLVRKLQGFAPLHSHMRKVWICGYGIELRKSTSGLTAHNRTRNALL